MQQEFYTENLSKCLALVEQALTAGGYRITDVRGVRLPGGLIWRMTVGSAPIDYRPPKQSDYTDVDQSDDERG